MSSVAVLSVTSRAARHDLLSPYLVFLFQIYPLIRRKITVLPLHVVDLGLRPDEFFRLTMARKTPFHLQSILRVNGGHVVYLAVARRTAHALCYVNTVVEISKLRKVVDAFPFDRFIVSKAGANRFESRTISPDLAMTIHAGLRRG